MNIRCTPTTSHPILGQFSNDSTVVLTNTNPQIDTTVQAGTQFTDVQQTVKIYMVGVRENISANYIEYGTLIDVDTLNVRSGAGTSYTILGTIRKGTTVEILQKNCATANGYTWHKIRYNNTDGYVVATNDT